MQRISQKKQKSFPKDKKSIDNKSKLCYHTSVLNDTFVILKEVEGLNKALLMYEMNVRKISIKMMCEKLGISRSAFYRKCNGITEFTLKEIQIILDYLSLESPKGIFF